MSTGKELTPPPNPINRSGNVSDPCGLTVFKQSFLACALWSSTYTVAAVNPKYDLDESVPFDEKYTIEDFDRKSIYILMRECEIFWNLNYHSIKKHASQAGHDFWLTRNGHGAGFWDRTDIWTEAERERMTNQSQAFGEVDLYVGDDCKVCAS